MPFKEGKVKTGGRKSGTPNKYKKVDIHFAINELNSFLGGIKNGGFYVYKHYLDNEVVYIGKGKSNRAWDKDRTSQEHIDIFDSLRIEVVCSNLPEKEALCIEKALIRFHKPKYNTQCLKVNDQHYLYF